MTTGEMAEQVVRCFESVFPDVPKNQLRSMSRAECDVWDSLAALSLLGVLEEEFGVTLDDEAADSLTSFDNAVAVVSRAVEGET